VAVLEKTGSSAILHFNEKITANNSAFGGIHPLVALESHQENLSSLVAKSLRSLPDHNTSHSASKSIGVQIDNGNLQVKRKPDFISVTRGPGMRSNLNTGLDTAKGLAVAWQIPIVGVHHMQAHALTPRLVSALDVGSKLIEKKTQGEDSSSARNHPSFPFLTLLVSGGHTLLLNSHSLTEHRIIADTDVAVGDSLDKIARAVLPPDVIASTTSTSYGSLLEQFAFSDSTLDYNYTPPKSRHEELTQSVAPSPYGWPFALPFVQNGTKFRSLEFSFAGVSSYGIRLVENGWDAVNGKMRLNKREEPMMVEEARHIARESMRVCFEHLASRIVLALEAEKASGGQSSQHLVLSGGVAANKFLRHIISSFLSARGFGHVELMAPPISLCTDNAAMIGWAGCEMWEAGFLSSLDIRSLRRWSLENVVNPEREDETTSFASTEARDQPANRVGHEPTPSML
jgi:N6-L-threonylcarbamoyladenine synthase